MFGTQNIGLGNEVREMTDKITDPIAKRAMLEIAANYEKLATRTETREAGVQLGSQEESS